MPTARFKNICSDAGITSLEDLAQHTEHEFCKLKGVGSKTLREARSYLEDNNMHFTSLEQKEQNTPLPPVSSISMRDRALVALILCGYTQKKAGQVFGISTSRVRQIERKILNRFRHPRRITPEIIAAHNTITADMKYRAEIAHIADAYLQAMFDFPED